MPNKLAAVILFILLVITSAYAASPEQPNSVPTEPNKWRPKSAIPVDVLEEPNGTITIIPKQSDVSEKSEWMPKIVILFKEEQPKSVTKIDKGKPLDFGDIPLSGECNLDPLDPNSLQALIDKANKGDPNAQDTLGVMCYPYPDRGVPQDYKEAFKWFTKAAEQGNARAQHNLGLMYRYGKGIPQDYKEAVKWYTRAAEQELLIAQNTLGEMYYEGKGVPQDYKKAFKWFTRAAEQGNASAHSKLGGMYYEGKGTTQDYKEAFKWFTKAAEHWDADAMSSLGLMYYNGEGVLPDDKEAVKWFTRAAKQGNALAQYNLGLMYRYGKGVPQDYKEAVNWYTRAAKSGNAQAQSKLGGMCYTGKGVPQDYKEAVKWYTWAAEQGDASAQFNLGLMYYQGQGVIEDYVEAYKWALIAGMNGEDVTVIKQRCSDKMTYAQIAKAQKLAKDFVAQKENTGENDSLGHEQTSSPKATGTGFFISPSGYIITAAHVVEKYRSLTIFSSAGKFEAKVILLDEPTDIAILKIDGVESPYLDIVTSSSVNVGDTIFTVGYPNVTIQGTEPKYTNGTISSLSGIDNNIRHFQISIPVQPGNSGGPLLSEKGEVVGVVVSRLSDIGMLEATGTLPQNVNYAVKSAFILPLLENLPGWQTPKAKLRDGTISNSEIINKARNSVALILVY